MSEAQSKLNFDTLTEPATGRAIQARLAGDGEEFTVSLRVPDVIPGTTQIPGVTSLYARLWGLMERYYREPLAVFSSSRTMLLPHQVEAALKVVSASRPRFLIADEVGLGKTIEAGLILKELKLKHGYRKILIVVPSPLTAQWQQELKNKFSEDFEILNGDSLRRKKPFDRGSQFLISIDLAKDERYLDQFLNQNFDLVIFDEAHRLRRDANTVTQAWHFAYAMSRQVEGFLLLSATPFRGKLEEIFFLIQLIDADILGPLATFQSQFTQDASLLRDRLSPVVIRRRKIDVGGFTKRFAKTVKIDLDRDERAFYDRTCEYVKTEFNRALSRGENLKTFIMIVFQKLLDSSAFALLRALEGRRARLEGLYFRVMHEIKESEDVEAAVKEFQEEEGFEESHILNPQEIRAEIQTLTHLAQLGKKIQHDSKLSHLKKTLKSMRSMGHQKFVIFTQFKSTLEYLTKNLDSYSVIGFHGGLNFDQKEDAIRKFFADTDILICTEAGGEGRNLQIAACLINYDLPWSPLKLEQRIGRIHRFGQTKDVHIVNFACRDTVAERVVEVLEEKIKLFENALGPSDTLLGAFESEYKFGRSLMSFLGSKKSKREHNEELERSVFLAKENLRNIDRLISTEHMSFNLGAFKSAMESGAGAESGRQLEKLIRRYANSPLAAGFELARLDHGTFDHDTATQKADLEFFAFGHELVDAAAQNILHHAESIPFEKIECGHDGMLFFFAVSLELDKNYRRLYRAYLPKFDGLIEPDLDAVLELPTCVASVDREFITLAAKKALQKIEADIVRGVKAIAAKVRPSENFWHHRIVDSAEARKNQLEEKLEVQRGKVKWYGEKYVPTVSKLAGEKRRSETTAYERLQKSNARLKPRLTIDVKKVCILSAAN